MTNDLEYLRARDIARLTGVHLRTARRWIANKILVSGKLGGARLVAKSELQRLFSPSSKIDDRDADDADEEDMED
jgi:excisionase family DNA binding protein